EWKILFLINGVRTLEELCHDAQEDPFHVYRVVYGLASNKLIEIATQEPSNENTDSMAALQMTGDATVRQAPAVFGAESTMREMPDDTSLLVSSEAKLSYKDVVKPTVAQLVITSGDGNGTVIPLSDPEYLVGRQRDNSIQLTDLGISGFHARIYRGPDGYAIEDLKSRNGTWLNATRVFHAVLQNGDRLRLGATELRFEVLYEE
ncbi:MAG TPA: FHA domain-containing protein, partial [Thermoanaerobaculia bacterium]|nr:FHA domain-containing protein [Thermoanaerobaculia bacterium]